MIFRLHRLRAFSIIRCTRRIQLELLRDRARSVPPRAFATKVTKFRDVNTTRERVDMI